MWNCKNCGKDNPDDRENCWSCGRNREQSEKIITGTEIVEKQSVPSSQNDSHPPAQVEMPVTEKQGGGLMNNKTRKGERSRGRTSLLGKIISGISAVVTLIAYFFLPWQQGQTGNMLASMHSYHYSGAYIGELLDVQALALVPLAAIVALLALSAFNQPVAKATRIVAQVALSAAALISLLRFSDGTQFGFWMTGLGLVVMLIGGILGIYKEPLQIENKHLFRNSSIWNGTSFLGALLMLAGFVLPSTYSDGGSVSTLQFLNNFLHKNNGTGYDWLVSLTPIFAGILIILTLALISMSIARKTSPYFRITGGLALFILATISWYPSLCYLGWINIQQQFINMGLIGAAPYFYGPGYGLWITFMGVLVAFIGSLGNLVESRPALVEEHNHDQ